MYHSAGAKVEIKIPEIEDLIKTRLDLNYSRSYEKA